ncbi:MAG: AI-2E family transporter [Spirochaetaceae bacterium]|nr:AI-2E family transporter [Spirochaetaceae bacterium]
MNNKRTLQTVFIFALFAFMFVLIIAMMYPFFSVILWTALLYILLKPLHKLCLAKLDEGKRFFQLKRHLLAGVFAIGVLLIIVVPLATIGMVLVQQLLSFLKSAEVFITNNPDFFSESSIGQFISDLGHKLGLSFINLDGIDIKSQLVKLIQQYSSKLISFASSVIAGTGNFLISLVFIDFALYFCFLDGRYLASLVAKAIPIDPNYMSTLMKKFTEITRHLFSGYILVALYQGIAAFVIMLIFGVKGALLLSVMLMLASFIPLFGTAIVWIPVGISICFTNSIIKGILFLVICGVCVSLLDNFLRPMFLKDRIKVHPLIIFFSILGGLQLFGMNGLLLGPMVVILFFTVLDMLNSSNSVEKMQPDPAERKD